MALGAKGDEKYHLMWNDLARTLNTMGPAIRSVSSWSKVKYIFKLFTKHN